MSEPKIDLAQFTFKPDKFCEQRIFTDFQTGEIVANIPVDYMGGEDPMRMVTYFGRVKLNANGKSMPVQFVIPAASLPEAIGMFPDCVQSAVQQIHSQAIRQTLVQASPLNTSLDLSKLKS
jgi:hypothetical protein